MSSPPPIAVEVKELRKCHPGQSVAVFYSDDTYWHERILLWKGQEDCWYIMTPDGDVYLEELSLRGEDGPVKMKVKGKHFDYWSSLRAPVYRFKDPVEDEQLKQRILEVLKELGDGLHEPGAWRPLAIQKKDKSEVSPSLFLGRALVPRRLSAKGGLVREESPHSLFTAVEAAADGYVWVADEIRGSTMIGDEIEVVDLETLKLGKDEGLAKKKGSWIRIKRLSVIGAPEYLEKRRREIQEALGEVTTPKKTPLKETEAEEIVEGSPEDARSLFVDYDEQGERFKEWRKVVNEMREYSFGDWPLEGPPSTMHLTKHMLRNGGDPRLWLQVWSRHKGVAETDRVMFELRTLIEIFYLGGVYDQLNIASLASFEAASRRIQSIVDAYSAGSAASPDWGAARIISGYRGPDDAVSPTLRSWAARKGKEEVELAQARAKIRETRKGLLTIEDSAADAVASGSLPGGGAPKPNAKKKGRGKGLDPPPQQ